MAGKTMKRGHFNGERYCGNFSTTDLHDLHNVKKVVTCIFLWNKVY